MDEMKITVGETLQSEPDEAAQRKWLKAENMGQWVTAIISMDTRRMSSEAIDTVASGVKLMVSEMEKGLRSINQFQLQGSIWPMDNMMVWAPDANGSQLEMVDNQQAVVV